MEFYKYDSVETLDDSKQEWSIRVRAQSIWKGITRKTGEFRGFNIIFFDDSVRTNAEPLNINLFLFVLQRFIICFNYFFTYCK